MKAVPLLLLFVIGLASAGRSQTISKIEDPDAYAIYSIIFTPDADEKPAKPRRLIIQDKTVDYPNYSDDERDQCLAPTPENEATLRPLINAYREANKTPSLLQRLFTLPNEYEIVPSDTIEAFFKSKAGGNWAAFYKRFPKPGGYVFMSAVGFNADRTMALAYAGHACGGLCGGGAYHFFKKVDGKWKEFNWPGISCTWVS
jgi:hypothetical protein